MLLDLNTLGTFAFPALVCIGAILLLKFLSESVPVLIWGYPLRTATLVGLGIAQIGEFSFVLARTGQTVELISDERFQFFVLVAISTMAINPFLDDANTHGADLIALATHGRSGIVRLFLGSVAGKLVRGTTLPVLLLRPADGDDS